MSLKLPSLVHLAILSGGSGATLEVLEVQGEKKVRKSIFGCKVKATKLAQQYEWMAERQDLEHIAQVSDLYHEKNKCSYLLNYYEDHISLHEYLETCDQSTVVNILNRILDFATNRIHVSASVINSNDLFLHYLKTKLHDKILACSNLSPNFRKLLAHDEVIINNVTYKNFTQCYLELINSNKIIKLNSTYRQCNIHGDLTFENILINPEDQNFVLIDPNLDNAISTPVMDYAKLCQSGISRYENMKLLHGISQNRNVITYDQKTISEDRVSESLKSVLNARIKEETIINLPLYEAIHFSRMLPYKLELSPESFPLFYARMIILLNNYLQQMES